MTTAYEPSSQAADFEVAQLQSDISWALEIRLSIPPRDEAQKCLTRLRAALEALVESLHHEDAEVNPAVAREARTFTGPAGASSLAMSNSELVWHTQAVASTARQLATWQFARARTVSATVHGGLSPNTSADPSTSTRSAPAPTMRGPSSPTPRVESVRDLDNHRGPHASDYAAWLQLHNWRR